MTDRTNAGAYAPKMVKLKALDVKPHHFALWCRIEDGEPFENEIVSRRWSDDGQKITFMLGTHNFFFASPDEEVELVPIPRSPNVSEQTLAMREARDAAAMRVRPANGASGREWR